MVRLAHLNNSTISLGISDGYCSQKLPICNCEHFVNMHELFLHRGKLSLQHNNSTRKRTIKKILILMICFCFVFTTDAKKNNIVLKREKYIPLKRHAPEVMPIVFHDGDILYVTVFGCVSNAEIIVRDSRDGNLVYIAESYLEGNCETRFDMNLAYGCYELELRLDEKVFTGQFVVGNENEVNE